MANIKHDPESTSTMPIDDLTRHVLAEARKMDDAFGDAIAACIDRLHRQCCRYEGYIENLEKRIAQARAALGMSNVKDA